MPTSSSHPTLCRNGCGFFGNPATDGMCSKCHRDDEARKTQQQTPTSTGSSTGPLCASLSDSMTSTTTPRTRLGQGMYIHAVCVCVWGGGACSVCVCVCVGGGGVQVYDVRKRLQIISQSLLGPVQKSCMSSYNVVLIGYGLNMLCWLVLTHTHVHSFILYTICKELVSNMFRLVSPLVMEVVDCVLGVVWYQVIAGRLTCVCCAVLAFWQLQHHTHTHSHSQTHTHIPPGSPPYSLYFNHK